jgi:hypothetical protein
VPQRDQSLWVLHASVSLWNKMCRIILKSVIALLLWSAKGIIKRHGISTMKCMNHPVLKIMVHRRTCSSSALTHNFQFSKLLLGENLVRAVFFARTESLHTRNPTSTSWVRITRNHCWST